MKLNEIYAIADALAPKALSDEYCRVYGAYDNSGILLDAGEETDKIVFSLDLSLSAVERAKKEEAKLIVTHHPAIYSKINGVRVGDFDPLGKKLAACLKNGISVVSMHLNLDAAPGGIDESLAEGIRLCAQKSGAGAPPSQKENVMHPLSLGGYGRVYDLAPISLSALAREMKEVFRTERLTVYGAERTISRAASFCGAGADEEAVRFAVENSADVIVSSDFKHHILALAAETGIAVIPLTHYASENYGFEKYCQKIRKQTGIPCVFHTDETLL